MTSDHHTPRRPSTDLKANLRRSRHRDREKRELMYLRARIHLLEQELEQLERRRRGHNEVHTSPHFDSTRNPGAALWRIFAQRQRREREEAERENSMLRAAVASQSAFAAQLQQLAPIPRSLDRTSSRKERGRFDAIDQELLTTLAAGLDTVCTQVDGVLRETGLSALPEAHFKQVGSAYDRNSNDYDPVDMLEVVVLQHCFGLLKDSFPETLLSHFASRGSGQHQVFGSCRDDNDWFVKFWCSPGSATEALFEVVMAVRVCQISPDAQMAAWRCLIAGDGELKGMNVNETGFSVTHRSTSTPGRTVMKRVRHLVPMVAQPRPPLLLTVQEFCTSLIASSEVLVAEVMQRFGSGGD